MSRSKSKRAAVTTPKDKAASLSPSRFSFPRLDPLGTTAALALLVAAIAPFVLWGNLYPDGFPRYWFVWGASALAVSITIAFAPIASIAALPARAIVLLNAPGSRAFALMAGVLATGISVALAIIVFDRAPNTTDEIAQWWQARILLSGRLSLPVDINPEFFGLDTVVDTNRWFAQFPIGGPLFLALGAMLGAPWIVNPVLAGAATIFFYQFVRRAFSESEARAAALLFALSPSVLFMSGTWMNHVPVLMLATASLYALSEWHRADTSRRRNASAACLGLALGIMATVRPLDAAAVAATVGMWQLWQIRTHVTRVAELAVQVLAGTIGVLPLFIANRKTTGGALRFGYDVLWGEGHGIGFHPDPYGNPHTVRQAFEHAVTYLGQLNLFVTGWPVPVLLLLIVALFLLRKATRWDALLLSLLAAQLVAYGAYWGEGEFLGPRFLFTALPTVILFVARLPRLLAERLGTRARDVAIAFAFACIVVAWCVPGLRYNFWGLTTIASSARQSMRINPQIAVADAYLTNGLVFLREPFRSRLTRRLWGAGVSRSETAQLIDTRDACSLLGAVRNAEANTNVAREQRSAAIHASAQRFVESANARMNSDGSLRFNSEQSVDAACREEMSIDAKGGFIPFGVALGLEPIGKDGRIDGTVIYVADLGEHNEVLRTRFPNRAWYRMSTVMRDGKLTPVIAPY